MDGTLTGVHWQWFLEVFLSPGSDFHDKITPIFNAVLPEGSKIMGKKYCYMHRFSKFLGYTIHSRWWNNCNKVFTILHWETLFSNCSTICWCFFIFLLNLCFCFYSRRLFLSKVLFLHQSCYWTLDNWPDQWHMFIQLLLFSTLYFSSHLLPLSQLFWDLLLLSKSRWADTFREIVKSHFQYFICFLCSTVDEILAFEICESFHSVFLYIPTFVELVLYNLCPRCCSVHNVLYFGSTLSINKVLFCIGNQRY